MARRTLPRRVKGFAVSARPDKTGRGTPAPLMGATLNTYDCLQSVMPFFVARIAKQSVAPKSHTTFLEKAPRLHP